MTLEVDFRPSHAQNMYLGRIILFAIGLFVLFALLSCNNRHDLTENYSVFTYGEGLYGESEEDSLYSFQNSVIKMHRHSLQISDKYGGMILQ